MQGVEHEIFNDRVSQAEPLTGCFEFGGKPKPKSNQRNSNPGISYQPSPILSGIERKTPAAMKNKCGTETTNSSSSIAARPVDGGLDQGSMFGFGSGEKVAHGPRMRGVRAGCLAGDLGANPHVHTFGVSLGVMEWQQECCARTLGGAQEGSGAPADFH
jgi:hypothetical protein